MTEQSSQSIPQASCPADEAGRQPAGRGMPRPRRWGQKLLGFARMEVRDELRRVTQNEMLCDWSTVWEK